MTTFAEPARTSAAGHDDRAAPPGAAPGAATYRRAQTFETPDDVAALYDEYGGLALALATRIVRDPAIAEDVVQEAFLSMWRSRDGFDPLRGSLRSWMFRIVHNHAIDRVRRRTRRLTEVPLEAAGRISTEVSLEDEVMLRTEAAALRAAVDGLPAAQATVLELAYFRGYTQTEIAKLMGTPVGTVKGRARLALRALSVALGIDRGQVAAA